ncbi:hypothetical protein [Pandoraea sputorum]|uniref:hypothetical protein n=1 Tax=Pandoraea sputorum TaxID=93222 RepID=UPI00124207B4|nr:hypothetical protein [Pandoraea sputorum]
MTNEEMQRLCEGDSVVVKMQNGKTHTGYVRRVERNTCAVKLDPPCWPFPVVVTASDIEFAKDRS